MQSSEIPKCVDNLDFTELSVLCLDMSVEFTCYCDIRSVICMRDKDYESVGRFLSLPYVRFPIYEASYRCNLSTCIQ